MTPLDYFLERWTQQGLVIPIHVVSDLHVDLNAMPIQWAGVIVQAQEYRNMTLGSVPWREENGLYVVGVFTRAGEAAGFAETDTAARLVRQAFMNWQTTDNALHVEAVDGPLDIDPVAEDGWHRLALEMRYQLWTQGP
jgi:hypothetical protein